MISGDSDTDPAPAGFCKGEFQMKNVTAGFRAFPNPGAQVETFAPRPGARETSILNHFMSELRVAVVATLALAVVVSGAYPLAVWAIAQGLFPYEAAGSLIQRDGKIVGSELIAQSFSSPKYFHPRPSAAGEAGYDAGSSSGSNLGPLSRKLVDAVKERVEAYRAENNLPPDARVPADAVTASGSGLDPHISLPNALLQLSRVAQARGMNEEEVKRIVRKHTKGRDLGVFGEPRINVLKLNLVLDRKI
jgi:K+-transporting ATPase ATPase C chain